MTAVAPGYFRAKDRAATQGFDIAYRPMTPEDLPLFAAWLEQPHWREWWGDPQIEVGYVRDMLEGRDTTIPYLFLLDEKPAGYIQMWFACDQQKSDFVREQPWLAELTAEAVGLDLSIADAAHLSRGLGSYTLRAFAEELQQRGFKTIVIDPAPTNMRAVRSYQKAGFTPVPHLEGRTSSVLIMQFEPEIKAP